MRIWPRPTTRALGLTALGVALLALAWSTGQQDLVWPGLFCIVLPLATLVLAWVTRPALRATRDLAPEVTTVGESAWVNLVVRADRPLPGASVIAHDEPGSLVGVAHSFRVDADRRGVRTEARYAVRPRRRGRYTLDGLTYVAHDPLELWSSGHRVAAPASLVVTPALHELPPARLGAVGEIGETPLPRTAIIGPDDATVREYHPGDEVRRIHWRSTARTGEIMVRREEAAWDPMAWLVLDNRAAHHAAVRGERPTFEWLVSVTASVGVRLLGDGFDVGLVDADGHASHAAGDLAVARARWLDPLVDIDVTDTPDLRRAAADLSCRSEDRLLVAILAALDGPTAELLAGLDGARQRPVAFVLRPDAAARTAFDRARDLLAGHGWDVREMDPDADLAAVWLGVREVPA